MRSMRITLDIADDVLQEAEARARRENKTTGQVVSEPARRTLAAEAVPGSTRDERAAKAVYAFRPFPSRGGAVTNRLIDVLRGEEAG